MSLPEVLLWQQLKQSDLKFRRQHPCGPYVVDFYCAGAKAVIEIEGIVHDMGEQPERDEHRFEWLADKGYTVMRFPASEILKDISATADSIVKACRSRSSP